ncbi:PREDICTED: uncharacterized protein LOC105854357 isoform X2 [Condylura cristata]|uniref:uncharacterized protein LOC105854357 isoform X2 n=1 Tax=Condylura cristata TaxID=143302 RepID=UPI000643A8A0|nr:PREDICTED: uncharacterized protein LOC105854357 isoform X2 [Condylura cristata]
MREWQRALETGTSQPSPRQQPPDLDWTERWQVCPSLLEQLGWPRPSPGSQETQRAQAQSVPARAAGSQRPPQAQPRVGRLSLRTTPGADAIVQLLKGLCLAQDQHSLLTTQSQ